MPVLAEAVDPLAVVGGEALLDPVRSVAEGLEVTGPGPPEVGRLLAQQFLPRVGSGSPQLTVDQINAEAAVDQRALIFVNTGIVNVDAVHIDAVGLGTRQQRAGQVVADGVPAGADPDAVLAPGFDDEDLVALPVDESVGQLCS
ncbi:hypothetical protein KZZ52_57380 [Dactylosporangium sp. AC04546]|nr:hypothetical protein KZZ52_57380 [Dactylosporangium sp. AC04546]